MKATVTVRGDFNASHIVEGHKSCERLHGHLWEVEASVSGEVSPKTGMVVDCSELDKALTAILAEFDNRHLNDMLPGVHPTPEGVASYIRERLIMVFPSVTRMSVDIGRCRAELEWSVR